MLLIKKADKCLWIYEKYIHIWIFSTDFDILLLVFISKKINQKSVLKEFYRTQKQTSVQLQEQNGCKLWNGKYRYFFVGMTIGILTGGIPLVTLVLLVVRRSYVYDSSTTATSIVSRFFMYYREF